MPIYEYACQGCDHALDALQKVSEEPLVDCPECGEPKLKRKLSAPRFRLKGQGWYETDFKKDNQRNLAGDREQKKADDKSADKTADKSADKAAAKSGDKPASSTTPAKKASKSGKAGATDAV